MKMLNIILLILASLLQIADGISSYLCFQRSDRTEANGILKSLFDKVGLLPGLIVVKGLMIVVCIVVYFFAGMLTPWVLGAICIGYAWVFWNNYQLI